MNVRETLIITRFDYRNLVRSAAGVTFLVLYLFLAILLGTILAESLRKAGVDASPKSLDAATVTLFAWFVGKKLDVIQFLVLERPAVMSLFFLASLLAMPILSMFLSFNQISGYVNRRSIRYIIPKTGRLELYLGLFTSNIVFFTIVSGVLAVIMTIGWALLAKSVGAGTVILYSFRIFFSVWLSCIPLIAFMSMVAALTGSPVGTIFLGLGAYGLTNIGGWYITRETEWGVIAHYLLPLEPKYWFAYPGVGPFLGATALMLVYTAVYLGIGWLFLRRRDL